MGQIIKCNFNLFHEGRKYTGHHRNYILESARKTCYAPETREKLRLREAFGYFGHGRRQIARKLQLEEVESVKLPDGSVVILENIPSNITTFFEVNQNGDVEHHQEILEDTKPGQIVAGLHKNKVGGFSWAMNGRDGGALGKTSVEEFYGFDYVLNPGFATNRGYLLESSDNGVTRDIILESVCQASGLDDKTAEAYLNSWIASSEIHNQELLERLEEAAIYEDSLREAVETKGGEIVHLKGLVDKFNDAEKRRAEIITESAKKSIIVVPDKVVDALLNMADENDFNTLIGFFESASRVDLNGLPLPKNLQKGAAKGPNGENTPPEYGTAEAAWNLDY